MNNEQIWVVFSIHDASDYKEQSNINNTSQKVYLNLYMQHNKCDSKYKARQPKIAGVILVCLVQLRAIKKSESTHIEKITLQMLTTVTIKRGHFDARLGKNDER